MNLNRVLAARRSAQLAHVGFPLAGSHPSLGMLPNNQVLKFQELDGFNVNGAIDTVMDDQQGIPPLLWQVDVIEVGHDGTTAGMVVSSGDNK
jgi:hypothetical protein